MAAPFIKPVRSSGGTLYIFTSASEDLNFLMNSSDERAFVWSKFVLLDIPKEARPTNKNENYIQYDSIVGSFNKTANVNAANRLAESFQNYCLNLESILLTRKDYNVELKRTISERVFFKWLKELGVLRFQQANDFEKSNNSDGSRFIEELSSGVNNYHKVVQYIGDIDMVNANKYNNNSYSEVYIHVPISHGNTKTVLFNTIEDENYKQNKIYQYNSSNLINNKYLQGRSINDVHPLGLNTQAFYDSPENTFDTIDYTLGLEVLDDDTRKFITSWSYNVPYSNSYITSKQFSDQHNDKLRITGKNNYIGKEVNILKSRLDGISIDFNEQNYYDIITNPNISTFGEYNQSKSGSPFEFNAVLLYYDVYEKATPEDKVTNLFGVLFLNKPNELSVGGSDISKLKKFKPNVVTGDNGNAWGLKVNIKLDVNTSDAQIETVINEYNTYSMELFLDAMSQLTRVGDSLSNTNMQFVQIQEKINELDDYVYRQQDVNGVLTRLNNLEKLVTENQSIFASNQELVTLINKAFTEINNIYTGKTSVEMIYNLDNLDSGFGIRIDNINKKKKINYNLQTYLLPNKPILSIINDFSIINNKYQLIIPNTKFTQIFRIEENNYTLFNNNFSLNKDIDILIDDNEIQWENGKSIRISFGTNYNTDSETPFNINFYTDANDNKNIGKQYGIKMNNINITSEIFNFKFITSENSEVNSKIPPIIEITCIDKDNLIFITDIF